jgi:hypothetical protein
MIPKSGCRFSDKIMLQEILTAPSFRTATIFQHNTPASGVLYIGKFRVTVVTGAFEFP